MIRVVLSAVAMVGSVLLSTRFCLASLESFPDFRPAAAGDYVQSVSAAARGVIAPQAETLLAQARVLSALGQADVARRLVCESLALDPNRPEVHLFLAELLVAQDQLAEAEDSFRRAAELNPDLPGIHRRLGMTLDRLGDRAGAQRAFVEAVTRRPDDATARLLLGRLLLDTDRPQQAVTELTKACALDPTSSNPRYALAQAQNRIGDRDQARLTVQEFHALKRKEQQAADARNLTRDDTQNVRTLVATFHTDLAAICLRQRQADNAEKHLRQAMAIDPDHALAHRLLADLLVQTRRASAAKPVLLELVRIDPADTTSRVNLGTLLLQLGESEPAVEHLALALQREPNQPEALNNLARFFLGQRRNLAEALEHSRRLAATQPSAASFDLLGWAAFANGLIEEARAASARAVDLDPGNPTYRQRLQRLRELQAR
jgi:tetratricopeptide (TPR) repeat protein